jgi:hypothetical protein
MSMFDVLKTGLKQVSVDGEDFWVAEGDLLLAETELKSYAEARQAQEDARKATADAEAAGLGGASLREAATRSLVGVTAGGKHVRWKPGTVLTYRVARTTFSAAHYETVVENMAAATGAWEETCGVSFRHASDLDERPGTGPEGSVFVVRELDTGGQFIAAAFFPNDPATRRLVLIDPSYYSTTFDAVGVLRHELGHVLGFRHEHIVSQAPPACPDEPLFDTAQLTDYDPQSVMHYFCGDRGSRTLAISTVDQRGSQLIYGPPLDKVVEIDPSA